MDLQAEMVFDGRERQEAQVVEARRVARRVDRHKEVTLVTSLEAREKVTDGLTGARVV